MTHPRSSLAIALQDYRGPRPGVALSIAAVALIAAMGLGVVHVIALGRAAARLTESQQTIRALHRYTAALEVWRQMAAGQLEFVAQRRLRDSLAVGLRTELAGLRSSLTDSTDRALVGQVLDDLLRPGDESAVFELGTSGREAMILLVSRQERALFEAASASQRGRVLGAILIALTVIAAGVLIIPMSWVYVRFKRGIPGDVRAVGRSA
jgi:hypothetical protein